MVDRTDILTRIEEELLAGRPVSDVLRLLIILGGRSGSSELRDWAKAELRGYQNDVETPAYRAVPALIQLDAIIGSAVVRHQTISVTDFPSVVSDKITETATFSHGVGELEALVRTATDNTINVSLPGSQELAKLLNHQANRPSQRVMSVYWSVSTSAVTGIIDQIMNRLAELIGELRASTPSHSEIPTKDQADRAVNVVINGSSHINVTAIAAGKDNDIHIEGGMKPSSAGSRFWTRGRRIGAATVGAATIAGTLLTAIQLSGGF